MKKVFALILCIAMLFSLCACGHKPEVEPEPDVTGTPEPEPEQTQVIYTKEEGILEREITYNPNGLKCSTTIYEYGSGGNVVKESFYGVNDAPAGYNSYEYDEDGRKTLMISYEATGPEEFYEEYRIKYGYNAAGTLVAENRYYGDELAGKTCYEYDAAGLLVNEKYYEGESSLMADYKYSYDENGRVSSVFRNDHMEGDSVENRYTYNADGLIVSDIRYDSEGSILTRTEFNYDKQQNETKCSVYSANGELVNATSNDYTYDAPGNIIKCVRSYSDGTQGSTTDYCWTYTKG